MDIQNWVTVLFGGLGVAVLGWFFKHFSEHLRLKGQLFKPGYVKTRIALYLMKEFPQDDVNKCIESSSDLTLMGLDLRFALERHSDRLSKILHSGGKVKVLILEPESEACKVALRYYFLDKSITVQKGYIEDAIDICRKLSKANPGVLELRLTDFLPHYGAVLSSERVIYFWLYGYKRADEKNPIGILRPSDGKAFRLYSDEINSLWDDARVYNL